MEGGVRRSPVVVGRRGDLERLARAVAAPGACLFLTGEGGIGKTRLLQETLLLARRRGLAVLVGRASIGAPLAFGVVAEALRSWLRGSPRRRAGSVYDAGLRLILPEWPGEEAARGLSGSQLRLLALEGLVDLLRETASASGALLAVEDLHAADPESLEALRYLVSAEVPGLLVLATSRVGEGALADRLVASLGQQGLAVAWPVAPLAEAEVAELLAALLGTAPPAALVADVAARADGIPLYVEEIVGAHLRAGSLVIDARGGHWRGGQPVVPASVASVVGSRLDRLGDPERAVLSAAAVVGAGDAGLLASVSGQPPATVSQALTAAVDAGLLESVGGSVEFRHAVVGDAIRSRILPGDLAVLHGRAASALGGAAGEGDLERLAGHLAASGDADGAALALAAASGLSARAHRLLRAETLAERAVGLASGRAAREAAGDALAGVLAARGRWAEALARDQAAAQASGFSPSRWARMARCALDGRQLEVVRDLAAQAVLVPEASPLFNVIAGRLALAAGDTGGALACARRAVDAAGDDAATVCGALDLQARALELAGRRDEAAAAWESQQAVALGAGLTAERIRALVSLAELELFRGDAPRRMVEVVEVARQAGALVEQAWAQLNLSIARTIQGDPAAGIRIADEAAQLCREHRLDLLGFVMIARLGAGHIVADPAFESMLAEARAMAGGSSDAVVHTSGIAGDRAMHQGRYEDALPDLRRVVGAMLAEPGTLPTAVPYYLVLDLLACGRVDEVPAALEVARSKPDRLRWCSSRVALAVVEAVVAGDGPAVDAALAGPVGRVPYELALLRVFAAEILGGPARARWLREALDLYEAHQGLVAVDRVRRLLREAGAAVPRRRRAGLVPPGLIAYGVTAREAEVLQLVAEGQPNAGIAASLVLSVRTVESHVSSLLAKFGVDSRAGLASVAGSVAGSVEASARE